MNGFDKLRNYRISHNLEKICPLLKSVGIRVVSQGSRLSPHGCSSRKIMEDVGNLGHLGYDYNIESKTTIETNPDSPFKVKSSGPSKWEIYRDYDDPWNYGKEKKPDWFYVEDTYYAIVDGKDIPKFIKDSGEMINGKDRIDPLGDGKFHETHVYVISEKEVLPIGIGELIRRKKEHRNMYLYLILREETAKEFIKDFKNVSEKLSIIP